ncbi:CarD family transcriptional regulator [Patescibacteria group bacterium]
MQDVLEQLGLKKRLRKLKTCPREGGGLIVKGVPAETKSFVLMGVPSFWGNPVLVMANDKKEVNKIAKELRFFSKNGVLIFPEFVEDDTEENKAKKQGVLQNILLTLEKNEPKLIITTFENLETSLINQKEFKDQKLSLKLKQNFDLEKLIKFLVKNGYISQKRIDVKGTFARRGGMLDIYLPNYDYPLRLEFLEDQLESILAVDLITGEIKKKLSEIEIRSLNLSLRKQGSNQNKTTILDHCDSQKTLIVKEESTSHISHRPSSIAHQLVFDNFPTEDNGNVIDLGFKTVPSYWGQMEMLKDDLITKQKAGFTIKIATKHKNSLVSLLKGKAIFQEDGRIKEMKVDDKKIFPILIQETKKEIPSFQNPNSKFIYLTDQVIFKRLLKSKKIKRRRIDKDFILSLKPNDFVVHVDHGVGKFIKMTKRIVDNIEREYFSVSYTEGDKLFVPVDQADRLNRYIGVENPTLNRLSGIAWGQAKLRVKQRTREIARKLLELYAQRELSRGHAFSKDTHLQKELEKSFPHQQSKALDF